MPTRRKPTVRLRKYSKEEEVLIVEFLADRMQSIQHSTERCEEMIRTERNEYTVGQLQFYRHSHGNMLWLLNTLQFFRTATPRQLATTFTGRMRQRLGMKTHK